MSSEWKVLGLIYIFLRPSKILSDLPLTRYLIHAVKTLTHLHGPSTRTHTHTHVHTHKPCIALKCASVWSVSVSGALTRHHSSCFLTTIQSNTGLQDWAKTLFHRDGCYYGNCGGVRPTSKPENAVLFCLGLFFAEKTPTLCLCICLPLFPSLLLFPMWEKHIPPRS